MFQNIGFTELLLIATVALVLFGPKKLPEIGRMLGKTLRDFKQAANEIMNDEPKAPQASNVPIATSSPVVPDPITPVSIAGVAVDVADITDKSGFEGPTAVLEPSEQGSINVEAAAETASSQAVKPAVAFVTSKSSQVIQIVGSPVETAEALSSTSEQSVLLAATDVLTAAPAQAPAPAQQAGSTSNSRRLPD